MTLSSYCAEISTACAPSLTTTTLCADDDGIITKYGTTTTVSYTTSVLSSIEVPQQIIVLQDSMAYVNAMNEEQLDRLENLLVEKGLEFEIKDPQKLSYEKPKVYVKSNGQQ